jgi:hypothetical protein
MLHHSKPAGLIALVIALLAALSTLLGPSHQALAAGPRYLTTSDMTDSTQVSNYTNQTIAGEKYAHDIMMTETGAYVTISPHAFPGYAAFTVAVGIADGFGNTSGGATLVVMVDGRVVKSISKTVGQAATTLTLPFGQSSQFKLSVKENQKKAVIVMLGNASVITSVPKAAATPPAFGSGGGTGSGGTAGSTSGKTTLKLFSSSVAPGSQETALITTGPSAMLTVVITYPSGSQQVLGPKKAGADGNFAYSWMVPGGMAGIVHVVVVSSSVAQATFTIQ